MQTRTPAAHLDVTQHISQHASQSASETVPSPAHPDGSKSIVQLSPDARAELRRRVEEMASEFPAFPYDPLH